MIADFAFNQKSDHQIQAAEVLNFEALKFEFLKLWNDPFAFV